MACVKADGYGHGISTVATAIAEVVEGFAVACIEEALALREADVDKPVLLLEGPHSQTEVAEAVRHRFTLCLSEERQLKWLEAQRPEDRPAAWLKIDTGMHRLGFSCDQVPQSYARLRACLPNAVPVLCSHFARADEPEHPFTAEQTTAFDHTVASLEGPHSLANSAAILTRPDSHRDWVRPGYMLYGGSPFAARRADDFQLKATMEFCAEVISTREVAAGETVGYGGRWTAPRPSRIATIAAGYGDGYPRHAREGTPVLIEGRRLPLVGRVSMDMITVDVTEHAAVKTGSQAILWGEDPGIDEVAQGADTIGYELLAAMPRRVPRRPG